MKKITSSVMTLAAGLLATAGGFAAAQQGADTTQQTTTQQPTTQQTTPGQKMMVSSMDRMFIMKASDSNLAEIKTSQLALDRATGQSYKDFAQHMIDDHTTAESDLKTLAQDKNVTLPDEPGAKNQMAATRLSHLNGSAFDSSYRKVQHDGHVATIALFKKEIKSGQDADIKAYAEKYLPKIEDHYKMLNSLTGSMGSGKM